MNHQDAFNILGGKFESDLGIIHHFSDHLYAKQMKLDKGLMAGMHRHTYSHLSILAKGKVIVRTDTTEKLYEAPVCINMPAEILHSVEALEDSVWFCIHSTDEKDVNKIDEGLIVK